MRKRIVVFIFCISAIFAGAQDIHFSQIQESPLWLNPANAGVFNGYFRGIINYRNQWASMGNAFQTMAVSIDGATLKSTRKKSYVGLGLFIFNDQAGVAKIGTTQAQAHVNAIIKTGRNSRMAGAIYLGMNQNSANYAALTFANQYNGKDLDNSLASGETVVYSSFVNVDAGAGINYEFSNSEIDMVRDDVFSMKIGAAIHHLNKPVQRFSSGSSYQLPMRFVGNIQARIDISETKVSFLPSLVYLKQASANEIILGTHFRYRFKNGTKLTGLKSESGINIGIYYRLKDAIVPQLNLDFGKYAFGFAYDYNISAYKIASRGSGGFEIYFKYLVLDDALFRRKREHGLN